MARRHSSKEVVTPPPSPPPPATPNLHPGLTGGMGRGMGRPPSAILSKYGYSQVPPNKKKKGQADPGKGSAAQHKGSLGHVHHPWLRTEAQREGKGRGKRPGPLLAAARTAAPFFFVVAAALPFPLCASYLHPQDGKHNTDCAAAAAAAAAAA